MSYICILKFTIKYLTYLMNSQSNFRNILLISWIITWFQLFHWWFLACGVISDFTSDFWFQNWFPAEAYEISQGVGPFRLAGWLTGRRKSCLRKFLNRVTCLLICFSNVWINFWHCYCCTKRSMPNFSSGYYYKAVFSGKFFRKP